MAKQTIDERSYIINYVHVLSLTNNNVLHLLLFQPDSLLIVPISTEIIYQYPEHVSRQIDGESRIKLMTSFAFDWALTFDGVGVSKPSEQRSKGGLSHLSKTTFVVSRRTRL